MRTGFFFFVFQLLLFANISAQDAYVPESSSRKFTSKDCKSFTTRASKKCDKLTLRLKKSTDAALKRLDQLEDKIFQQICFVNERQAESLMRGSIYSYRYLEDQIMLHGQEELNSYVPELDSLNVFTSYLATSNTDSSQTNYCECNGLDELKQSQQNLKCELKRSQIVGNYIKERNTYLHKVAIGNKNAQAILPSIEKLNYYNNQQVQEYLSHFADRSRPEKILSGFLNSIPGFSQYANLNGSLASFNSAVPNSTSVAGLQTKEEVYAMMSDAISKNVDRTELLKNLPKGLDTEKIKTDANAMPGDIKGMSDNSNSGTNELKENAKSIEQVGDTLKTKNHKKSNEKTWNPNPLKTKRFVDRLQYGLNMQADPPTRFFPTTATILGQVSFQVTTKMNVGIGTSFMTAYVKKSDPDKKGVGTIVSDGYSLRSFYDFKIKGNLFLQMNYECNFRNSNTKSEKIKTLREPLFNTSMRGYESWLTGAKLKTGASKKRTKTMEVLYDFRHKTTGQPSIVVRFGMEFSPKHGYRKQ